MKTDLAVALDFPTKSEAEKMLNELFGLPLVYKVGLELFLSAGPDWVRGLTLRGLRVFLDLKFHDIPNTVAAAVAQAHSLGAEFTTIHLCGGAKMVDALTRSPKVLGVSVLTSFSEGEWARTAGLVAEKPYQVSRAVLECAAFADSHIKIFGMVCSPREVSEIRAKYPDLFLVVPGIRLAGSAVDDQARTMSPAEAAKAGASMIVVGRPITKAEQPRQVAEKILKEIGN